MKNADDYRRLAGELAVDMELLKSLQARHSKAVERASIAENDELLWAAVGYTIHNLYCLFENYFLRISKFFENGLDPSSWHAELVDRMCAEVAGVRPRLFDAEFARRVDVLRRFRHAFRNMYQSELDPRRIRILNDDIPGIITDFTQWHRAFVDSLAIIADGLSS